MQSSKVLRRRNYRRMPWRNGLGTTLEIAREPARGDDFEWRLSLAAVEAACDFSAFRGCERALVLVSGERLALTFDGHGARTVTPAARAARFSGDWKARCEIPDGPCTDLSLIVRTGPSASRPRILAPAVYSIRVRRRLRLPAAAHVALFALAGSLAITEEARRRPVSRLREHDVLILPPDGVRSVGVQNTAPDPSELIVLRWRPLQA